MLVLLQTNSKRMNDLFPWAVSLMFVGTMCLLFFQVFHKPHERGRFTKTIAVSLIVVAAICIVSSLMLLITIHKS